MIYSNTYFDAVGNASADCNAGVRDVILDESRYTRCEDSTGDVTWYLPTRLGGRRVDRSSLPWERAADDRLRSQEKKRTARKKEIKAICDRSKGDYEKLPECIEAASIASENVTIIASPIVGRDGYYDVSINGESRTYAINEVASYYSGDPVEDASRLAVMQAMQYARVNA